VAPLLVFGAGGQVGRELLGLAEVRGIEAVGLARADADITDPGAVRRAIARHAPRLIVNAAAYTAVDKAESEPQAAASVNAEGAAIIARAAAEAGTPLVHISTDYVFDGAKAAAYDESDPVSPLGIYGQTKAAGEAAVRAAQPQHVILRTAWVYGVFGANFLKTMLRLAGERDSLRVVADQRGCPTSTIDIAEAILAIDRAIAAEKACSWGTYHFAGTGVTTWHGFASEIVAAQKAFTGRDPPVAAITTAEYPTPARRPANSELDSSRFAATFGYRAAPWQERVREAVAAVLCAGTVPR